MCVHSYGTYATADYTVASRFAAPSGDTEFIGSGGGVAQTNVAYTYASMGSTALIGWYSFGGSFTSGLFGTDKRLVLESAWLANGSLNLAVRNDDATANSALALKMAFYE